MHGCRTSCLLDICISMYLLYVFQHQVLDHLFYFSYGTAGYFCARIPLGPKLGPLAFLREKELQKSFHQTFLTTMYP